RLLSLLITHRRICRDQTSHRIGIFNFARGEGHGEGVYLCWRVASRTQVQKVGAANPATEPSCESPKVAAKTFRAPLKATLLDPVATCFNDLRKCEALHQGKFWRFPSLPTTKARAAGFSAEPALGG